MEPTESYRAAWWKAVTVRITARKVNVEQGDAMSRLSEMMLNSILLALWYRL